MTYNEVILGCSPFTLAYHFGHRSRLYELDFTNQPENIQKVMDASYDMDVNNIMLKHNVDLENAIKMSEKDGKEWNVYGITSMDDIDENIKIYDGFNTSSILLNGQLVDDCLENNKIDDLVSYLDKIKDSGYEPAIETRTPFKNIPIITSSDLINHFDTIMIPFNFYGYMMDCNFFNGENKDIFREMINKLDKKIIANRTLATGILKPREAYEFIKDIDYIDSVCVGVAKESEAEETFGIINKYKS